MTAVVVNDIAPPRGGRDVRNYTLSGRTVSIPDLACVDHQSEEDTMTQGTAPEASLAAMTALGSAWRGDWSDFDGRALRDQLDELDVLIRAEVAGDDVTTLVENFYSNNDICQPCGSWRQHCSCPS